MTDNRKTIVTAAIVGITGLGIGIASTAAANAGNDPEAPPSKQEVAALFDRWNASLATLDAEKVANEYASDAVLLPTVSNEPRTTRAAIVDYFAKDFLPKKPQGVITES
ncbi:MAG: SgcJ/EcaC family oxidoreductase, partial [Mycobacteriaceae bacterium]